MNRWATVIRRLCRLLRHSRDSFVTWFYYSLMTSGVRETSTTDTHSVNTSDEASPCIVCGDPNPPAALYPGIVRCSTCSYVAADLRLTDEELFNLYNEQFFTGAEFS